MVNPLQLLPGVGAVLNWRAHRRQAAEHAEMLAKLENIEACVQPEDAFPARPPHYAPSFISVPRGRLPKAWSSGRSDHEAAHQALVREWSQKLDDVDAQPRRR